MARKADVVGKCASPWCIKEEQNAGAWCSAGCKQAHSRVRKGEKPMPELPEELTPVTVLVSIDHQHAIVKSEDGETIQIRELTEKEALQLIEKLKPVARTNVEGYWFRYTLKSIPDIGNVENTKGDWR